MATGIFATAPRLRNQRRAPLRGLGAVPAGVVIAYQLDMKTAGARTRTDGVMDSASCNALAALIADIRSNPTSASSNEVIHDAEVRVLNDYGTIQALCAGGGSASAPAPASSGGASSSVPTQYWADARVKSAQTLLNAELAKAKCSTTLKADGLIGPGTCGALMWAVPRSGLSQDLIALVQTNAKAFEGGCTPFKAVAPACPAAPSPLPPAPAAPAPVDGKQLMVQLQGLLNQALARYGYKAIPVSGKWDAATCGAGATVNPLLPLGDALRSQIGSLTGQVIAALGKPCGVTIAGTVPAKIAAPAPAAPSAPPAPAPAPAAKPKTPDPCFIEFGTKNAVVTEMQGELNRLLAQNGYEPIAVTGVWDPASCGALYVLGGQFDPYINACRGGYWSVPASCPQKILPTKKATPTANASMLGAGLLALVAGGAAIIAHKKGFF